MGGGGGGGVIWTQSQLPFFSASGLATVDGGIICLWMGELYACGCACGWGNYTPVDGGIIRLWMGGAYTPADGVCALIYTCVNGWGEGWGLYTCRFNTL